MLKQDDHAGSEEEEEEEEEEDKELLSNVLLPASHMEANCRPFARIPVQALLHLLNSLRIRNDDDTQNCSSNWVGRSPQKTHLQNVWLWPQYVVNHSAVPPSINRFISTTEPALNRLRNLKILSKITVGLRELSLIPYDQPLVDDDYTALGEGLSEPQ